MKQARARLVLFLHSLLVGMRDVCNAWHSTGDQNGTTPSTQPMESTAEAYRSLRALLRCDVPHPSNCGSLASQNLCGLSSTAMVLGALQAPRRRVRMLHTGKMPRTGAVPVAGRGGGAIATAATLRLNTQPSTCAALYA